MDDPLWSTRDSSWTLWVQAWNLSKSEHLAHVLVEFAYLSFTHWPPWHLGLELKSFFMYIAWDIRMKTSVFQPLGCVARVLIMALNKIQGLWGKLQVLNDGYLLASCLRSENLLLTKLPSRLVVVHIIDGSRRQKTVCCVDVTLSFVLNNPDQWVWGNCINIPLQ